MQFTNSGPKQRRSAKIKKEGPGLYSESHNLQFYKLPPTETISLQEFEEFAVERLKVLKAIESTGLRHVRNSDAYSEALDKELKNTVFKNAMKSSADMGFQRIDHISHFILRLAYCKSEELRRWFLQQELDFFRYRFCKERSENIEAFLKNNHLDYNPIDQEEKEAIISQLAKASNVSTSRVEITEYYKVHFTEALDLVKGKRVYLEKGFAYVPKTDLVSIIVSVYRTHLSHALAVTSRALPHLEEDARLLPRLGNISKQYLGQDYNCKKNNVGKITADMIDMLSKKSFPLCMQHLQQSVKQNHHLKHWGRLQYGLFLKGIGITLEEAMKFWRSEFCKIIDVDKFDKQYSYGIRHMFGKEGKRTDYTPYSCMKIIMTNPPALGDNHGCPFRHTDGDLLAQRLRSLSLPKDGLDQVMHYVKGGHYQMACTKVFELTHGVDQATIALSLSHPNQYFEESRKLADGVKPVSGMPQTPRSVKMSQSQTSPKPSASQTASPMPSTSQASSGQLSGIDEMDAEFPPLSSEEMDIVMQEN